MVGKTFPFHLDRFLGNRNNHIEFIVQCFTGIAIWGVSLKWRSKKISNRRRDPIKEMISAGKEKSMGRTKVEFKELVACKLDSRLNFPHMGDMENVEQLLRMLNMVWSPRAIVKETDLVTSRG